MRWRTGFTLIEVVISVALAASLVAAVYGALVATTRVSERQEKGAERSAARARALEVLRADFRGRTSLEGESTGFKCDTTADALLPFEGWRCATVWYVVTEEGLVRKEAGTETSTEVVLLPPPVALEFRADDTWRAAPGTEVEALRITFGEPSKTAVIR